MMNIQRPLLFIFLLFAAQELSAQMQDQQKIRLLDSLFTSLADNKMSMGSISIYRNGTPFYEKIYGISNRKEHKEITSSEKTLYRIGSVSKIFTAFMMMKLKEEGKISLSNTIDKYFPALKNASNITIEQMLSHRSLLPVFVRVDDLEKLRKARNEMQLIKTINKYPENTDTGKVKYNNLNYILAGLIAEKVTGKPYNDILTEDLAGLTEAKIRGTYQLLDAAKDEANSFHLSRGEWVEDFENTENHLTDGSGFLVSDAGTINRFLNALFAGKLLQPENIEAMLPRSGAFGFGLMKTNFGKHKGYGHTGRIEGFTSAVSYFPDEKISVTFLQNGTVYPLNDIMLRTGSILFDEKFEMPELKKMELSEDQEKKIIGTYANDEEGYKVITDMHKGKLRLRIAKGSGLLNKMILEVYALKESRLFNPLQGIMFDFKKENSGTYSICEMRVNGAVLVLKKADK